MSIDFSIKPVGSPAAISVVQPIAAQNAVATQLPASQSVTAVDASAGNTTRLVNPLFGGNVKKEFAAAVGITTSP